MGGTVEMTANKKTSPSIRSNRSGGQPRGTKEEPPEVLPKPSQTPLYRATQGARYQRQDQIREIEGATERTLICYISGAAGIVERDDVLPLTDLLHRVKPGAKLDVMLHTLGGDVDAAEKIAGLLLKAVGISGELRLIVPDCAKSAGTLISLAARSVVMSDTSELGPIDPQILTTTPDGVRTSRPAQSYLDGYDELLLQIREGTNGLALQQLLTKLDPALLDMCRKALARSRKFAEKFLRDGMFRGETANYTDIASSLSDNAKWLSHGAVINADDAMDIGLRIDYRDKHSNEWQAYWRLYCDMRLALGSNTSKLFESDYASLQL
jgi:hypothetical protein